MFSLFSAFKKKSREVTINGIRHITTAPGETILQAGLRQKVRLPHNCRVGGCAECKCKLVNGKVKELTESAYVLSSEEMDQGYILACQSVPKTDISIEVERLESSGPSHEVKKHLGKIISHEQLTHDTVKIQIALPEALDYASGQYAQLSLPGTINQSRAYSFATSSSEAHISATVSFFIRAVPGGEMSNYMQEDSVIGNTVELEGPHGDFYLRDGNESLLCIAGGSGLAPIKSLLENALENDDQRPVTFIFGARTQADLYCLHDIMRIAQEWSTQFTFIPVLSDEPEDSDWRGHRGFVTDEIEFHVTGNEKVYMCGPPPMIDAAEEKLKALSIQPSHIFYDKFLDRSHVNAAA